jgi:alkanesulfonate monooxygenase SsuD/methylene tetrahydromethanopterin reductase-like flavin-dependent oxidoreductase (luciferase family)
MAKVGYTLMTEEAGPKDLVRWAARAEEAGFGLLVSSDHYFRWLDKQDTRPTPGDAGRGGVGNRAGRADGLPHLTDDAYHPAVVAQQAATLPLLSDNRFTLGLAAA